MADKKPFVAKHGLAIANSTNIVFGTNGALHANNTITSGSITDAMLAPGAGGEVANAYLTSTFVSNSDFQSALANTNTAIADRIQVANATLLINDRMQVANVSSAISTAISDLVDTAPATLDTLNELAAALGDDANFASTVTTNLGQKLGATATVTLTGDVTAGATAFSSNSLSLSTTVAASVTAPYLEVANASVYMEVSNTNTLVNDRLQVANAAATYQTIAIERAALANTNTAIADRIQVANATLLINDRLQVANAITTLAGLTDVSKTTPTNDQVIRYSTGNSTFYFGDAGGGTLASLTDVAQVTPTDGYVLKYASANTTYYFDAESGGGAAVTANSTVVTANGTQTTFTSPYGTNDPKEVFVTVDGLVQRPTTDYTISGTTVTFGTAPLIGTQVMVRVASVSSGAFVTADSTVATANGTQTTFTSPYSTDDAKEILVSVDGLLQRPTTDYTISGTTVTFGTAPLVGTQVMVRVAAVSGLSASYVSNADFQSTLANTNTAIADRLQVANAAATYLPLTGGTITGNMTVGDANTDTLTVNSRISSSLIPSANITYDLGSAEHAWRDLYLSGNTINLDGTLISKDDAGDVTFKDKATGGLKRVVASEIQIGIGVNRLQLQRSDAGKLITLDSTDTKAVPELNLQDIDDVSDNVPNNGQVLKYSSSNTTYYFANEIDNTSAINDRMQVANVASAISTAISDLVDTAPTTLDTLNELAAALGDDANFATTVTTNLGQKLGASATVTLTGDVTASATAFSSNSVSLSTTVAASVTAPYLEVANATSSFVSKTSSNPQSILSNLAIDSTGATSGVHISSGEISIFTDTGVPSFVDFYCEVTNAHYTRLQSQPHSAYAGNVTIKLPISDGVLATTTDLATVNTAIRTLISDRLQVANAITTFAGLTDIAKVTPTDGHVLKYSSANTTYYFAAESGGGGGGGASVTVSNTAPVSPSEGDLWFDEDDATLYVRYGTAWIDAAPAVGSVTSASVTADSTVVTANGTQTTFTSPYSTDDPKQVFVTVDGILQRPTSDYTISGTTLTFDEAPAENTEIMIRVAAVSGGGGGASSLADLTDIAKVTPTDGHVLKYSSANTTYYFAAESGGGSSAANSGLTVATANGTQTTFTSPVGVTDPKDIIVTVDGLIQTPNTDYTVSGSTVTFDEAPYNGEIITIRTTTVNVDNVITEFANLTDIAKATPANGHVLKYSSANSTYYFDAESGGGASSLADLTDLAKVTPTDGHVLKYSASNTTYYFAAESGGGASNLADLADIAKVTPTNGHVLKYSSANNTYYFAAESGGGGGGGSATKTYIYDGLLSVSTGSDRIYINSITNLSQLDAFVRIAPIGDDIDITINKNGSSVATITIANAATSSVSNSTNVDFAVGDYITVDITSVGTSTAGSDLQLILTF